MWISNTLVALGLQNLRATRDVGGEIGMIKLVMKEMYGGSYMVIPREFRGNLCDVTGEVSFIVTDSRITQGDSDWAKLWSNRSIGTDITLLMEALEGLVEFTPGGAVPNYGSHWILKAIRGCFKRWDAYIVYWLPSQL